MITADIHTHSSFSSDSDTPLRTMIEAAVKKGLSHYCVTEHYDYAHHIWNAASDPEFAHKGLTQQEVETLFICDTDSLIKEFSLLKEEYSDRIELLLGMELGLQPGLGGYFSEYAGRYPFDFLIGSCHEAGCQDPYYALFFSGFETMTDAVRSYFTEMKDCVMSCHESIDTLGHPDYGIRYHRPADFVFRYEDYADILDEMLEYMIDKGIALECNSGSFRRFERDAQPIVPILRRYRQLGGSLVTVGSDAHDPDRIGKDFDIVSDMLKGCGFDHIAVFKNRKPLLMPI